MQFNRRETCRYIRDTTAQLAQLSNDNDLEVIAHILSMAQLEADNRLTEMLALI